MAATISKQLLQTSIDGTRGKPGLIALLRAAIDEVDTTQHADKLVSRTNAFLADIGVRGCMLENVDAKTVYLSLIVPFTVASFGEKVPPLASGCMARLVLWWMDALSEKGQEMVYKANACLWNVLFNGHEYHHDKLRATGFQAVAERNSKPVRVVDGRDVADDQTRQGVFMLHKLFSKIPNWLTFAPTSTNTLTAVRLAARFSLEGLQSQQLC